MNSLKVPKIKKILLYEMKFLIPNHSCLQKPWLGGHRPQIPVLSVLCPQLNLLNPRTKFLGTPLMHIRYINQCWCLHYWLRACKPQSQYVVTVSVHCWLCARKPDRTKQVMFVTVYTSLFMDYKKKKYLHWLWFWARSQNSEKRLLASSCLSAWNNSAPAGRILTLKVHIWVFFENLCRENSRFY